MRPAFNSDGLPESIKARAIQKAAQSWCYVAQSGGTFYVAKEKALSMQANDGGEVFPPVIECAF